MPTPTRLITVPLLALLFVVPAAAGDSEESKLFQIAGWATYGAMYGDLVATEHGLARGAVELNPLQRNCLVRTSTHIGASWGINYATAKLYHSGHEKAALWIRLATTAAYGYIIARNLRISGRAQ